jgi:pimeloyl-ACP methyl ester carboxylesterase
MAYFAWLAALAALAMAANSVGAQAAPATQYLATQQGRLAFDDTGGAAPLVIALPGMGDVRAEYRYLSPRLAAAGYRMVTMDVRGFGETSAAWPDYSAHAVGRDVLALIDHLGAANAVVIGTSFAAGSALWAAHDAPGRVRGVVLISPMLEDAKASFSGRVMLWAAFAGPWRVAAWGSYWNSLFKLHPPSDQAAYRAALLDNLREPGRMDALRAMVMVSKADTAAILGTVKTPALLIVGTADPDFNDAVAEAKSLATRTGGALLPVPGAGHYPHVEAPDIVAPRVVAFLRQLP